ncbi:MAG TPA: hypothetical protein PK020_17055 [Ilumatobacteraceae bacterium]|nr:hypothetical protein [Ilumatobacteraceae bacterium]
MIDAHFEQLRAVTSTRQACHLLGRSRASHYRAVLGPMHGPRRPRPAPPNTLTEAERQKILTVLRSPEYCDLAPAQIWARLLDDAIYLCSISTMYRLLRAVGENRERRRQRTHPANKIPELMAMQPNQIWSWDIKCRHRHLMSYADVGTMPILALMCCGSRGSGVDWSA